MNKIDDVFFLLLVIENYFIITLISLFFEHGKIVDSIDTCRKDIFS